SRRRAAAGRRRADMRALVLTIVVAVLAAVSPWGTPAAAQGRAATDRPVDRIVAVVGTRPILASQVEEQLVLAQSQGQKVPQDSAASVRALQLAESLVVALRKNGGATFADVAKKYSADSVSRAQGGVLGWFRRGVMVKEFEDVAFRLRPGAISDVVRTEFGFHIIQVERAQPAEIMARHILIQATISAAQIAIARRQADSVHDALAHGASFDTLARRYADPS